MARPPIFTDGGRILFWAGRARRLLVAPCLLGGLGMSAPPANLAVGIWGGEQVVLTIGTDQAVLRLGCAEGHFPAPRIVGENDRFAQTGSLTRHGGGPSTADERPLAASYEGKLQGDRLTLTVRQGSSVDTYTLTRGVQSKVIRCL